MADTRRAPTEPTVESAVEFVARLGIRMRPEDERRLVAAVMARDITWGRRIATLDHRLERLQRVAMIARDVSRAVKAAPPGRSTTLPSAMFTHLATELDHLWTTDLPRD